ncbi:hypothetical protein [Methanobrevibacter millerae]|uniref:Uncharacterized protein n=1 Tax=Methanobrevibacter millerae TaxID=230361 RepID=A0A1G5XIV8_9EURY|nr:hypothetical protein [Methanobrevibacter millerae]SDA70373.1 hypothetical protein SAMN02910315_02303 [Methanobrevibacter millerae]
MSTIGHFVYFINCVKDSLSFSDAEEFTAKIRNDFDFRLKVQKFVYISKYFGWNHSYKYILYIRGPYSSALADEYYNEDILKYSPLEIEGFDSNSFNDFVGGKTIPYLESASTILYYMDIEENFTRSDAIQKLQMIKPHIDSEIVRNAYEDIIRLNFFKNKNLYEIVVIDENLDNKKEILLNQINAYVNYFSDFGKCNNSIIVSGSLDYLSMVLEKETLDLEMKNDLLELLSNYVSDVKKIYDLSDGNPRVFEYMNLNSLENKFNRIQDYISQELGIFPRLYDSEFELDEGD